MGFQNHLRTSARADHAHVVGVVALGDEGDPRALTFEKAFFSAEATSIAEEDGATPCSKAPNRWNAPWKQRGKKMSIVCGGEKRRGEDDKEWVLKWHSYTQ